MTADGDEWRPEEFRPRFFNFRSLEQQFQTELDGARAARSHHGIGRSHIRRGASAAECRRNRRIVLPKAILTAVWIGKVRMVQQIEELYAELGAQALSQPPVLSH